MGRPQENVSLQLQLIQVIRSVGHRPGGLAHWAVCVIERLVVRLTLPTDSVDRGTVDCLVVLLSVQAQRFFSWSIDSAGDNRSRNRVMTHSLR